MGKAEYCIRLAVTCPLQIQLHLRFAVRINYYNFTCVCLHLVVQFIMCLYFFFFYFKTRSNCTIRSTYSMNMKMYLCAHTVRVFVLQPPPTHTQRTIIIIK